MTRGDPNSNAEANALDRIPDSDWQRAHAELERLAAMRARLQADEGYWLLRALRTRAHAQLGYGSFAEYIERLFGYDARWTKEKLRVAEALEQLPELGRVLAEGVLSWSAVRELSRVATAETEAGWIEAARGKTLRELERQVSGRRPGDRPGDAARPEAVRHVLRFEVCAETLAVVREAMGKLRRDAGSALDDDAALLLMARQVLGGPVDEGRSSYQVLVTVCEQCGRGALETRGELVEVGPEVVEMASCDAQRMRAAGVDGGDAVGEQPRGATHVGHGAGTQASRTRDTHVGHDGETPANPVDGAHAGRDGDTHVGHAGQTRSSRAHDTGVHSETGPNAGSSGGQALPRATQDIPPAIRRWVVRRDRGCCVVPGCRNAVFVDIHHLSPRSEGGDHDPEGLVVLCAAHHRAVHRGQLVVEGRVTTGLTFRHADGRRYGEIACAAGARAWADVFGALRSMGFAETETRHAIEKTRREVSELGEALDVEPLLRRALGVLMDARGQRQAMPRLSAESGLGALSTNAATA
ncbi:MAG: HNH endonuclease [Polyangiaceae bacterium]|nr:HNH endonuclease [Polyangiaceae bacterium]